MFNLEEFKDVFSLKVCTMSNDTVIDKLLIRKDVEGIGNILI